MNPFYFRQANIFLIMLKSVISSYHHFSAIVKKFNRESINAAKVDPDMRLNKYRELYCLFKLFMLLLIIT